MRRPARRPLRASHRIGVVGGGAGSGGSNGRALQKVGLRVLTGTRGIHLARDPRVAGGLCPRNRCQAACAADHAAQRRAKHEAANRQPQRQRGEHPAAAQQALGQRRVLLRCDHVLLARRGLGIRDHGAHDLHERARLAGRQRLDAAAAGPPARALRRPVADQHPAVDPDERHHDLRAQRLKPLVQAVDRGQVSRRPLLALQASLPRRRVDVAHARTGLDRLRRLREHRPGVRVAQVAQYEVLRVHHGGAVDRRGHGHRLQGTERRRQEVARLALVRTCGGRWRDPGQPWQESDHHLAPGQVCLEEGRQHDGEVGLAMRANGRVEYLQIH
mmetsp:Transcript_47130/g.143239  ORF Transcript_47130/g.143239 Transcript_47130/m.143239 type:complete len:330 (-) Transcript_47130:135-1124(-)